MVAAPLSRPVMTVVAPADAYGSARGAFGDVSEGTFGAPRQGVTAWAVYHEQVIATQRCPHLTGEDMVVPQFGIFDHLERQPDLTLELQYEERLALLARADALGFYSYHLAEHHQSPLCMAPSPSIFLAAAARQTRQLKLGALVYMVPFYHPLRLIEELCMLDQLSGGRLQIGIGRGITAIEHTYWGMAPEDAQTRTDEVLEMLVRGLTTDTLTYDGQFHHFDNIPLEMTPKQKPHPPFWS